MRARTATVGDLEWIFSDISSRLSQEYAESGRQIQAVQDSLMMDLKEGRAHALLDEDDVQAVITWHEVDSSTHTLFAARDEFFRASTVRFSYGHIRHVQRLTGNLPIRHRSWLDRSEVAKWFKILGFRVRSQNKNSTVFELAPQRDDFAREAE